MCGDEQKDSEMDSGVGQEPSFEGTGVIVVAGLQHLAELYRSLITCTVKNAVAVATSGCAGGMDKSFGSKAKIISWGKKKVLCCVTLRLKERSANNYSDAEWSC